MTLGMRYASELTVAQREKLRHVLQTRNGLKELLRALDINVNFALRCLSEPEPEPVITVCASAPPTEEEGDVDVVASAYLRRMRAQFAHIA